MIADEKSGTRTIAGLYAIADGGFCPAADLPAFARRVLEGGCRLLQLRLKGGAPRDVLPIAREIAALRRKHGFTFIVNDHVEVALAVGADGVHVGEHDAPIGEIRKRAGRELLVGYSAHALPEAVAAAEAGADYVAFGAIFPTATKGPGHPVQGLARLAEVVRAVALPVVAIGGIGRDNVSDVLATGARSVAMIGALAKAADVARETRWFVEAVERQGGER